MKRNRIIILCCVAGVLFLGFACWTVFGRATSKNNWLDDLDYLIQQETPYADYEAIAKRAVEGDAKAKAVVVQELMRGDLVEADRKRAAELARDAAKSGHPIALYWHQCLVEEGYIERPFLTGDAKQEWLEIRLLCERYLDEPEVQEIMARLYYSGAGGLAPNPEAAYFLCQKSCEKNIAHAWFRRAFFHQNGVGGAEWSEELALECFLKAARLGSAEANHHLAYLYIAGIGTEANRTLGLAHLVRAAKKKCRKAEQDLQDIKRVGLAKFLISEEPIAFAFGNVQNGYRFSLNDKVVVKPQLSNGEIHCSILERKNGKYLVEIEELHHVDKIAACPATGQIDITHTSIGSTIWVSQFSIDRIKL